MACSKRTSRMEETKGELGIWNVAIFFCDRSFRSNVFNRRSTYEKLVQFVQKII